jgi:hypothetical protein
MQSSPIQGGRVLVVEDDPDVRMTGTRVVAAVIVAAGLALLAAACGGSPASRAVTASAQQNDAVAYARCMRSHGVPNWPDPNSGGVFDKSKLTSQQLGAGESKIQAAQSACRHLLPNGGRPPNQAQREQIKAQGLQFARCVRAHGVPRFPDPRGDGRIPDPATVGIDQGSPKFEAANQACGRYRPPYIPSNAAFNAYARTRTSGS